MRINNNLMAMNTHRQLGINSNQGAKSIEKLSSGFRINRAGDDAAGLSISEKMRGQIRGLNQASRNSQDGISLIQTAEGALNESQAILQRMRELAVQSANDTNVDIDRDAIQNEINQLSTEINRIGNTTEFNTQKLLNGGIDSGSSSKITQATSASVAGTTAVTGTALSATTTGTLTVDNITFDISGIAGSSTVNTATLDAYVEELGNVTAGGTKLSDLVDITHESSIITFTAKSTGDNSELTFAGANIGGIAAAATDTGDPTTIERHGIEAGAALGASADTTISADSSFKITVGDGSAVTVNLNTGTEDIVYKTNTGADDNEKEAAMQDVIRDVNAALQDAGLSGQVTASLSKDNKVQLISETGLDITLEEGTNSPLSGQLGFTTPTLETVSNIEQVVGPGAEGSGFSAKFQIGANQNQAMQVNIADMRGAALGITGNSGQVGFTSDNVVTNGVSNVAAEAALDVSTHEKAASAVTAINTAIEKVSAQRSELGSFQNRLEHTIKNLDTSSENLQASESRIRDVDMAAEMMEFTKNNILQQAAQAMLAQANNAPQGVLQLLR